MKYIIDIDLNNPRYVYGNQAYYDDVTSGISWMISDRVKDKLIPLKRPERKKGKWIPIVKGERGYSAGDFQCSVCCKSNPCYHLTNYCPNCGADMRGAWNIEEFQKKMGVKKND